MDASYFGYFNNWIRNEFCIGLKAKEIHLCGEPSALALIEKICQQTGDEIEINHYSRLAGLTVSSSHLNGAITNIKKGDFIISFSSKSIFVLKKSI